MTKTLRIILAFAAMIFALPCGPVGAETQASTGVDRWEIYGASQSYHSDAAVPGGGIVQIHIEQRTASTKAWDSGATLPLPYPLRQGEQISAVFWARAGAPVTVPVTLSAGMPPYTSIATTTIALTPSWQRFVVTGTTPADVAAGSHNLAIQLGLAPGEVSLGPVLWMHGEADQARIVAQSQAYTSVASHVEDVRIALQPGVTLEGTLRTPRGTGPFPLLLCFTGSGPNPRGAFKTLGNRLLAEGIAVFEYDKRGVGRSTGTFDDTIPQVQSDAAVVMAALRVRPDIDSKRIAVCGLSQGGVIAPALAANDPTIAAVVMFAGPVGARSTMFLDGLRRPFKASKSPAAIDHISEAVRVWMDARVAKEPQERIVALRTAAVAAFATEGTAPDQAEGWVAVLDTPVLLSMYDVDPGQALAQVKAPVLALYGEKDTSVRVVDTVPAAKAALRDNPDATIVEIPNATHGFRDANDATGWPIVMPRVLDLVTKWLVERLHPVTSGSKK